MEEINLTEINNHNNEVHMIGESKLWKFCQETKVWEIYKIFSAESGIYKRLVWLDMVKDMNPNEVFALSQHNPDKSVGA